MPLDIRGVIQQLNLDPPVELFEIDATALGGTVLRIAAEAYEDGSPFVFDGNTYTPIPCQATGFEWNGEGPLPTPRFVVTNVAQTFRSTLLTYGNLIGAGFTRIRTFKRFLDGQSDANPAMRLDSDIYRIDRKVRDNPTVLEFELSSDMDQAGRKIPGRLFVTICQHTYRIPDGNGGFDTTHATCPYAGGPPYYDRYGNVVPSADQDACGFRIRDCKNRFGTDPLPFWGFPSVGTANDR